MLWLKAAVADSAADYGGSVSISPELNWRMSVASNGSTPPLALTSALAGQGSRASRRTLHWRMNAASMGSTLRSQFASPTIVTAGVGVSADSTVAVGVASVPVGITVGVAGVPVGVTVGVAGVPVGVTVGVAGVPVGATVGVAGVPVGVNVGVAGRVPLGVAVGPTQWTVRSRTLGTAVVEDGFSKPAPPLSAGGSPNSTRRNLVLLGSEEQVNDSSTMLPR